MLNKSIVRRTSRTRNALKKPRLKKKRFDLRKSEKRKKKLIRRRQRKSSGDDKKLI